MNFDELRKIEDESEQINATYEIFDENTRLNHSQAARVEFLTTVSYIEKYLNAKDRILDIGAGAGEYSLYFADKGYEVCSLELASNNIRAFREKITPKQNIELIQGNALDLSHYESHTFDVVLLLGPLYHLHNKCDRQKCISEAKRVCKKGGHIFIAFISNDMVCLTESGYNKDFFKGSTYDHKTFKVEDFPFVFFKVDTCREMLAESNLQITHEIASDGVSELMESTINSMDNETYAQYLRYHFYTCEKPEMLGHSNHLLFVCTNHTACHYKNRLVFISSVIMMLIGVTAITTCIMLAVVKKFTFSMFPTLLLAIFLFVQGVISIKSICK